MDMHVDDRFNGRRVPCGRPPLRPGQACHVTVSTRGRTTWFGDFHVACEVVRGFRQPRVLGDATLLAWVLLPDHVHWLIENGRRGPVEEVVSRMKAASGALANRMLFRAGPLWEPGFRRRTLDPLDDVRAVARTLVTEPVRAGVATRLGDYPFWDLAWL